MAPHTQLLVEEAFRDAPETAFAAPSWRPPALSLPPAGTVPRLAWTEAGARSPLARRQQRRRDGHHGDGTQGRGHPALRPGPVPRRCYVDGAWVGAADGKTIPVTDPASGETLGTVPSLGVEEVRRAVDAAERALQTAGEDGEERAAVPAALVRAGHGHADDLAHLMTREQGKPLAEARASRVRRLVPGVVRRGGEAGLQRRDPEDRGLDAGSWCSSSPSACALRSRPGTSRSR